VSIRAAGPLGSVIETEAATLRLHNRYLHESPNALILLRRVAFFDTGRGVLNEEGGRALLKWASGHGLGQDEGTVRHVAARRGQALSALQARAVHVVRLRAEPEWRLAVGLGNKANAHEIGLSLHGTYGWPVIPGSSLKGLAASFASASGADSADMRRVLGAPRPGEPAGQRADSAAQGTVRFLDASPAGNPVTVMVDVLTPHVKPYYDAVAVGARHIVPPAEHHNPVPVNFLTVSGAFAVDLYGRTAADVEQAADWLIAAADELGAGAKTAAGYGYMKIVKLQSDGA
jgi:CRISPR/Cas system CMR subunit Cmr6 (Cas7 group RAMP superfamily)